MSTSPEHAILVVETDDAIRAEVTRLLAGAGFRVIAASSVDDALELARRQRGPLEALVSEPGLEASPGRSLAVEIERLRPGIKAIPTSAGTMEQPFEPARFLELVRATLVVG